MKRRLNSEQSYNEVKAISDEMYAGKREKFAKDMLTVLEKYNVKIRPEPHILKAVTFSLPTSLKSSFVVGLRYRKPDTTYTEDHLLFEEGKTLKVFSKNELERVLPEYKGTHKEQPNFFEQQI